MGFYRKANDIHCYLKKNKQNQQDGGNAFAFRGSGRERFTLFPGHEGASRRSKVINLRNRDDLETRGSRRAHRKRRAVFLGRMHTNYADTLAGLHLHPENSIETMCSLACGNAMEIIKCTLLETDLVADDSHEMLPISSAMELLESSTSTDAYRVLRRQGIVCPNKSKTGLMLTPAYLHLFRSTTKSPVTFHVEVCHDDDDDDQYCSSIESCSSNLALLTHAF